MDTFGVMNCYLTKNHTKFLLKKETPHDIRISLVLLSLGFGLNLLSLIVFLRLYRKPQTRNHIHIFFIYLSISEVLLNYSMMVFFLVSSDLIERRSTQVSIENQEFLAEWASSERVANLLGGIKLVHSALTIILLSVRNWWVALTAVLRSYVAAQTTQVRPDVIYSASRITIMYIITVLIGVGLDTSLRIYRFGAYAKNYPLRFCNTSITEKLMDDGVLAVLGRISPVKLPPYFDTNNNHSSSSIPNSSSDNRSNHQMIINTSLTQALPFLVILIASCLMIFSLRRLRLASVTKRNKRITRMIIIFALIFFLLEMPRSICTWLRLIDSLYISDELVAATNLLQVIDSVVNAIIYYSNDPYFRQEVLRIFNRRSCFSTHTVPAQISTNEMTVSAGALRSAVDNNFDNSCERSRLFQWKDGGGNFELTETQLESGVYIGLPLLQSHNI